MRLRPLLAAVGLGCALIVPAAAQNPPDTTRSALDSALRVFFDCPNFGQGCDFDFIRTEITFVNWVRDRESADVHLLVSTQETGGGGDEYTLTFIGRGRFSGTTDTLRFFSASTQTSDEIRRGLARVIKVGLIHYVARTPLADKIQISYTAPSAQRAGTAVNDPWNYWVFTVRLGGNYFAEKSQNFFNANSGLSATRTTDLWKFNFSVNGRYSESNFHLRQDSVTAFTIRSVQRRYDGNALLVRSLGNHWSAGLRGSGSQSTFLNQRHVLTLTPAIEYAFFPYSQSTRRFVTLQYAVGINQAAYLDTTIYERTQETLPIQRFTLSVTATQPWGTVFVSAEGSAFYRNNTLNKNSLSFFGNADIRLFKGFSLSLFGSVAFIHDQLFLPKAGVDEATLLLQRRQLETSFSYQAFLSLSYRFGSTFNNIVNPRFGSGGGFFFISN
jgi:hypothetical protein